MRKKKKTGLNIARPGQRKRTGIAAIALAATHCWCQVATPPTVQGADPAGVQIRANEAQEPPPIQATPPAPPGPGAEANTQVLQTWQEQTGQAVWIKDNGTVEFHGASSLDVYGNDVSSPSGNPALSGVRDGNKARGVFQGDIRTTSPEGDVTYLQGVLTSTNDRGVQARYATQVNTLQVGRAGPGYQVAFGDVVAGFSNLSSNLGLRGGLIAKEVDAFTMTAFAGVVAESWEALGNAGALDGLQPRTRYLRDVSGAKVDWRYSAETSFFATVQGYSDRTTTAALPAGTPAFSGSTFTIGGKQQAVQGQWAAEAGTSRRRDQNTGTQDSGHAVTLDGSYRWQAAGVRAGFHDLSPAWASLAQTVAPGVREYYAGADWSILPELNLGADLRHSISRVPGGIGFLATSNELDSLTTRLSYSVQAIPGLLFSASDTRNRGNDNAGATTRNNQTQLSAAYGTGAWSGQVSVSQGESGNSLSPAASSQTRGWQASLGRSIMDGSISAGVAPGWTLFTSLFASGQQQDLVATGTSTRNRVAGLNLSLQSLRWGNLSAALQGQSTTQPLAGAPELKSRTLTVDWSRAITQQWSAKAYARWNRRNHGDLLLQVDERVIGVQGAYQW
ncbi:MAG: hypothetical protein EOO28_13985 [Comamonadaceae bacterium]|nr:MAG: hypothetical protein EOO28_13985 [Comamonadaceae bacterium]